MFVIYLFDRFHISLIVFAFARCDSILRVRLYLTNAKAKATLLPDEFIEHPIKNVQEKKSFCVHFRSVKINLYQQLMQKTSWELTNRLCCSRHFCGSTDRIE